MTFIQPNKRSLTNKLLVLLSFALVAGTFAMVGLYNATVNANHNIAKAKADLDAIGAETTDMNNRIVATLSGDALQKIAAAHGLVAESKPQYFPINQGSHDLSLHALNR